MQTLCLDAELTIDAAAVETCLLVVRTHLHSTAYTDCCTLHSSYEDYTRQKLIRGPSRTELHFWESRHSYTYVCLNVKIASNTLIRRKRIHFAPLNLFFRIFWLARSRRVGLPLQKVAEKFIFSCMCVCAAVILVIRYSAAQNQHSRELQTQLININTSEVLSDHDHESY